MSNIIYKNDPVGPGDESYVNYLTGSVYLDSVVQYVQTFSN